MYYPLQRRSLFRKKAVHLRSSPADERARKLPKRARPHRPAISQTFISVWISLPSPHHAGGETVRMGRGGRLAGAEKPIVHRHLHVQRGAPHAAIGIRRTVAASRATPSP